MDKSIANPCTRCGQQRIETKTWKGTIQNLTGTTSVTYTESVCPDPDCQKIVDKELAAQKKKRDEIAKNKEDRITQFRIVKGKKISISTSKI